MVDGAAAYFDGLYRKKNRDSKTLSMGIPVLRVLYTNDVQRLVLAQKRPDSYILGEN